MLLVCCLRPVSSPSTYLCRERCRTMKHWNGKWTRRTAAMQLWLSVCSSATAAAAVAKTINVCANTQSFTYLSQWQTTLLLLLLLLWTLNGSLIMMIMILISGLVTPVPSLHVPSVFSSFFFSLLVFSASCTSISQLPIINCVQTRSWQGSNIMK